MARESDIYGLGVTLLTILPTGASALLIDGSGVTGAVSQTLKYFSGGSLEIINAPKGATTPGASLASGSGYLMAQTEILNVSGPARYYLLATGATTQAYMLWGLSQGF